MIDAGCQAIYVFCSVTVRPQPCIISGRANHYIDVAVGILAGSKCVYVRLQVGVKDNFIDNDGGGICAVIGQGNGNTVVARFQVRSIRLVVPSFQI